MANSLSSVIPLIFAQTGKALRSNAVMPRLVNSDYSAEAKQKGDTVRIPLPSALAVNDVVPGPYAPDPQAVSPYTVPIPLNFWKEVPFTLNEKEIAQIIDGVAPMQLTAAVEAMATYVNASILNLGNQVYGYVGTAGTTPFATDFSAAVQARRILGIQKAPMDNRRMVINPDAEANAIGLPQFYAALNAGTDITIRKGQIGEKIGFDWQMDQQVPTHVSGTQTGTVTASGAQIVGQGVAAGGDPHFGTALIAAAAGASVSYNQGDIITFAGDTQTYCVGAAVTIAASSTGTISISPPLQVAKVGGETVSLKPSHVMNLAFQRDAFAFVSRNLKNDELQKAPGTLEMEGVDPQSGLAYRIQYRSEFHRSRFSIDMLWGTALIRPELAVRVAG